MDSKNIITRQHISPLFERLDVCGLTVLYFIDLEVEKQMESVIEKILLTCQSERGLA